MRLRSRATRERLDALSRAELGAALQVGRLQHGAPETTYAYGKTLLAGFLAGFAAPGFDDALATARQG